METRRESRQDQPEIDGLVKWMVGLLASIWLTLIALLPPIIIKTLGIVG